MTFRTGATTGYRLAWLLAGTALVLAGSRAAGRHAGGETLSQPAVHAAALSPVAADVLAFFGQASADIAAARPIRVVVGSCGPTEIRPSSAIDRVKVVDYDTDGDPDVLGLGVSGQLFVWENRGNCRLAPRLAAPLPRPGTPGLSVKDTTSPYRWSTCTQIERIERPAPCARTSRQQAESRPIRSASRLEFPPSIVTDAEHSRPPPPDRAVA